MSAIVGGSRPIEGHRRPSLLRLTAAVIAGECLAAVVLWVVAIVNAALAIAPIGGAQQWVWLPWRIDDAWALAGAVGWGYLVCALVAGLVSNAIARRGLQRPAAGWMLLAIAISGYGAMAVARTPGTRIFVAVLAGAAVIRLVAFNLDGSARSWRWPVGRRLRIAAMALALLTGLSYSGTHAFAADGDGGTYAAGGIAAHVGQSNVIAVGLSHMDMPVQIAAVRFTGPGAVHVSSSQLLLSADPGETLMPARMRHYPGARHWSGVAWSPTRLPYRIPAGQDTWISTRITLRSCDNVTIDTLALRYSVLGISTGETIRLQTPLTLTCQR